MTLMHTLINGTNAKTSSMFSGADISNHTDLHITTQILEGAQGLLSVLKLFSRDYYLAFRDTNIRRCELELIIKKHSN